MKGLLASVSEGLFWQKEFIVHLQIHMDILKILHTLLKGFALIKSPTGTWMKYLPEFHNQVLNDY